MSTLTPLQSLASAIGTAEGYGIPNAIPTLANNPGDLVNGDIGYGTMGSGITIYPSAQAGNDALANQLGMIANGTSSNYSPSESISQIGSTWAGGSAWANNVASALGVTPSTSFASLLSGSGGTGSTSSPTTSTSTSGILGTLSSLTNMLIPGATAANAGAGAVASSLPRIASAIVGLILIAAGVFSFDKGREIIVAGAKTAAEVVA